jgi:SAM-dependent methyltransferase
LINDAAATGFERGAADYERARPSYPAEVLEALPRDGTIVDIAAGTGKLTRLLPGRVIAVEPVAAMRAIASQFAPTVAGTAEHVPLRDASADAVTVAQAFHWFDAARALAEVRRVLKPGGTLLMVWNDRDNRVPWVAEMTAVIHAHDPGAYQMVTDWEAVVAEAGGFTPLELSVVDNPQRGVDIETVVARATSTSYVSAAGDDVVAQVASDVRAIVGGFEEPFDYPYVTQIFTCTRS